MFYTKMELININTKGMHCPGCEVLVTEEIEELEGVHYAKASHGSGVISVEFDRSKTTQKKIEEVIRNRGHEVL